jgi:hydrophobic/amphiphilic exporter-1 (mainly G- bacteria), HAE1 family
MIHYFASHPTAANLLMIFLLALGLFALPGLQRETFPSFDSQMVEIRIPYPGASAEVVESALCLPVEDALSGLTDLDELRCDAREGVAIAVAQMIEGGEVAPFLDDVTLAIGGLTDLPAQSERAEIRELNRTDRVVSIAIAAPMTTPQLKLWCETTRDRLLLNPAIPKVAISGFGEHQLRIEPDRAAMQAHGIDIATLARTISRQGIDAPLGILKGDEQELLVRLQDERRSVDALASLVVLAGTEGRELRLGDLATLHETFDDEAQRIMFNGERACLLTVSKNRHQDTLRVFAAVERAIEEERAAAPPQIHYHLTQNTASIVESRLSMLVRNGAQGLLLVLLVLWLFFGRRYAFWVAMGLPVSFMAGLFLMGLFGQSINMISMVALLVALGLLMDDAIVLAENIAVHRARGKSPLAAAVEGSRQVAPGVLSSFLTTLAVFAPLAFLAGQMGMVLRVIPIVLIIVLFVSLIEAFLILPHHLNHSLAAVSDEPINPLRRRFETALDWLRENIVGRLVDTMIAWRYVSIAAIVALLIVSVALLAGGKLKFQGFPSIDGDLLEARILLPQGTPVGVTEQVVAGLVDQLAQMNREMPQTEGKPLIKNVMITYGSNRDAGESGPHLATISVDLLEVEQRNATINQISARWRELAELPAEVINVAFVEPSMGPGGMAIDIRLKGEDLGELKAASLALQDWLAGYTGVSDLMDNLRPGKIELHLTPLPGALALGVDATTIASQLRAALLGESLGEVRVGKEPYAIEVSLVASDRQGVADLEAMVIQTEGGAIPLTHLVAISEQRGLARIQRIDGRRTITLQGYLDTELNNGRALLEDTRQKFLPELKKRYPSVEVSFGGEAKESAQTANSMLRMLALGLLGIFIILSFQFHSYREPLMVMAIIPLATIGVFWGHLLMGMNLSMPSMIGLVSLAGIAVNDSILLVAFIREGIAQGLPPLVAAAQASRARFRAVLLTSATTIVGLLPILAEPSLQAQVLKPLVASIAFGLLATTLLVLLLIPTLYAILHDLGWTRVQQEH